jgi:hypothetical protein
MSRLEKDKTNAWTNVDKKYHTIPRQYDGPDDWPVLCSAHKDPSFEFRGDILD